MPFIVWSSLTQKQGQISARKESDKQPSSYWERVKDNHKDTDKKAKDAENKKEQDAQEKKAEHKRVSTAWADPRGPKPCFKCRNNNKAAYMLMCEGCDDMWHQHCLPKL